VPLQAYDFCPVRLLSIPGEGNCFQILHLTVPAKSKLFWFGVAVKYGL